MTNVSSLKPMFKKKTECGSILTLYWRKETRELSYRRAQDLLAKYEAYC